ncbi:energy coupling factor transporter S component ThiW [Jeotgalicoccus aerolatus]|jgi:energy coupling factor transporter S component ThiW|nr:energy coupling factor transporter S component ThiW [Jeotgalicoccus aerolatus]NMA81083.1 energy coupling factor transporter S component ThiW [Jeotgalicoccus aerolatus]HJG32319.1 energy coupling factor transporter S component ThiW [Jeotgalicoccus aerolatus]
MTLTAVFVALNVILSSIITFPIGIIRAAPMQHLINVLGAVMTGPWVIVQAFISSTLRVLTGTGTVFAFPGSMIGALAAWLLYKFTKKLPLAALGEVLGTGIIGALSLYPLIRILNLDTNIFTAVAAAFFLSSLIGSAVSYFILKQLEKRGALLRI